MSSDRKRTYEARAETLRRRKVRRDRDAERRLTGRAVSSRLPSRF